MKFNGCEILIIFIVFVINSNLFLWSRQFIANQQIKTAFVTNDILIKIELYVLNLNFIKKSKIHTIFYSIYFENISNY